MENVYLVCAALGVTLWVCQVILSFLGAEHDIGHDASGFGHGADFHGHGGDMHAAHEGALAWVTGLLTIRTLIAAIAFFGLGGLGGTYGHIGAPLSLGVAILAAAGAMIFVGTVMKLLAKLPAEGTLRIENAIGQAGSVYLTIPAQSQGPGKITLKLQERLVEYQAITKGEALPTGTQVKVVGVVSSDTVEVIRS